MSQRTKHNAFFRNPVRTAALIFLGTFGNQFAKPLQAEDDAARHTFVEQKIVPLLKARCFECHSDEADEPAGSLLLNSRTNMLHGGDSGAAIEPGQPDDSLLIQAVRYESFEMPPRTRLPEEEVNLLVRWIRDGAYWPKELDTAAPPPATEAFPLEQRKAAHWAWQPIQKPDVPAVDNTAWPRNDADRFVLNRLEDAGMSPNQDADRRTLIRRLSFDLIGLPPTVSQVDAFVSDPADDDTAIATLADELLASPHFGERWGRHWLDLVRYAETLGHEFDYPLPHAWKYRDYVIRAFNADVPYDQLLREHVAGDLLPDPRRHPDHGYNESVIGTGFWFLGEDKHAPVDVKGEEAARIDNQLDVFSKAFLGLTVACARCHDHKFDAISTKDYYALSGFLQSSRRTTAWLDRDRGIADCVAELRDVQRNAEHIAAELLRAAPDSNAPANVGSSNRVATDAGVNKLASAARERSLQEYAAAALYATDRIDASAVTTEHHCDPATLQRWVERLGEPATRSLNHPLSLLATLVQSPDVPLNDGMLRWTAKVDTRRAQRLTDTAPFADLRSGIPADWLTTGPAFESPAPSPGPESPTSPASGRGDSGRSLCWTPAGPQFLVNGGVTSATLSPKLTGTLTSPTFELTAPEILIKVAGVNAKVRLVIDGYVMNEFSELLFKGAKKDIDTEGKLRWIRMADDVHRYEGHRAHLEFIDDGEGWFTVQEIRFANQAGATPPETPSSDLNVELASSLADGAVATDKLVKLWAERCAQDSTAQAALLNERLIPQTDNKWKQITAEWTRLAGDVPSGVPVMAMTEGTPENEHIFIRGNHGNPGPPAERTFLDAIGGTDQPTISSGSGRLELAERMLARDNPFPARVAVNRIWQHLFGVGIVSSPDNFGVLGQPPSHPHLLDHLADRFRRDGWSVKSMIRTLVTSRTYRLSSLRTTNGEQIDSTNRLFHRANIRRLEGETIRDAILHVSGSLDPALFGESVPVYLTEFMQGRGRPKTTGPLDGNGRRSLYVSVNRNFLSPFMLAFDVPAPMTTMGDRGTSNVPAQALILLNNKFVAEQSARWAAHLLQTDRDLDDTLQFAWQQLFARPADPAGIEQLRCFMKSQAAERGESLADQQALQAALADVCHVLLNSKEFVFLN